MHTTMIEVREPGQTLLLVSSPDLGDYTIRVWTEVEHA